LYLTEVDAEPEADAFFPAIERAEWRESARESHAACERNPYAYSFVVLERAR
jgi:dihydrofolate reductase